MFFLGRKERLKEPTKIKKATMKNSQCLMTSIAIMKYSGIWMPDNVDSQRKIFYVILGCLTQIVLFFFVVCAEIGFVFTVLGDTERTVDAAVLLLSHLVQGVKVLTIYYRQDRIKRLIRFIDGPDFVKTEPKKKAILDRTVNRATIVGQVLIASAGVTALFWCIVPILKTEITLPLKTAYPFDISGNVMFCTMYIYNSISVAVVGIGDAAENYLVSGMLVLAGAQIDVLCMEMKEIGAVKETSYEDTVLCIKYHQNIIKYVDELAAIFGLPILCQFVTSSVIVCMTLFKITITTEPIELITMIFYLNCVFMELLMYCYPGDLLINKSILVSEAAYPVKWEGDVRSQRALLMAALRGQRALAINAGGVFRVSLPTAAGVVQTAYSYYAFLRQKMAKET